MADTLTLVSPSPQTTTSYTVQELNISTNPPSITIVLLDNLGNLVQFTYGSTPSPSGATATTLLHSLNIGNFSVISLHKRIIQQLQADNFIGAGAIAGVPV